MAWSPAAAAALVSYALFCRVSLPFHKALPYAQTYPTKKRLYPWLCIVYTPHAAPMRAL